MQPQNDNQVLALSQAFAVFNDTARALGETYHELERRVAHLSEQLALAHDARLRELASKERLAEKLHALLQALPGGVVVLDGAGRVGEANAAAHTMLGRDIVGRAWAEVAAEAFGGRGGDGRLLLRDGREFALSRQDLSDGGRVLLFTDVTRNRQLQARLDHFRRLSSLGEMCARLAHQLRTPLSAGVLYASRIAEGRLEAPVAARLGARIVERLRHLQRLIDDMLAFSQGGNEGSERVKVGALLEEVRRNLGPDPERAGRLEIADRSGDAEIDGRPDLIGSALGNLIDNAISFSPPGLAVRLQARRQGGRVVFRISDSGPGVAGELAERIFDPFFTTRSQGTGLGLAVVRSVAAAHGGTVALVRGGGPGAVFEMDLPEARCDEALPSGGWEGEGLRAFSGCGGWLK